MRALATCGPAQTRSCTDPLPHFHIICGPQVVHLTHSLQQLSSLASLYVQVRRMEAELEMAQQKVEEAQKEVQDAQGELLRLKNAAAEVEIEEVEPAEEPDVPQKRAAKVRGVQPAPAGCRDALLGSRHSL